MRTVLNAHAAPWVSLAYYGRPGPPRFFSAYPGYWSTGALDRLGRPNTRTSMPEATFTWTTRGLGCQRWRNLAPRSSGPATVPRQPAFGDVCLGRVDRSDRERPASSPRPFQRPTPGIRHYLYPQRHWRLPAGGRSVPVRAAVSAGLDPRQPQFRPWHPGVRQVAGRAHKVRPILLTRASRRRHRHPLCTGAAGARTAGSGVAGSALRGRALARAWTKARRQQTQAWAGRNGHRPRGGGATDGDLPFPGTVCLPGPKPFQRGTAPAAMDRNGA